MDVFTFGMVAVGAMGGSLLVITTLEKYGFTINNTAISVVLEMAKAGGLLYLIEHISKLFL